MKNEKGLTPVGVDADVMPPLPSEISSDGREIWDWASKFSSRIHLLGEANDLRRRIAAIQKECGSCTKWMIPRCPNEKHDNRKGRSVGPSMSDYTCGQFEMKKTHLDLIEQWRNELAEVEKRLGEART